MQGYVPGQDEAFTSSRKCFRELEDWMASEEAAGLQHGELEEQLDVRGRELLRQLFQDRLDATAAREERRHDVAGEDGVVRTRAEKGRERPLVTKFGQVTVSRIAYRSPGRPNVHPADAALNLPEEKHSHGLRKMAAIESARGSMEAAGAAITRATGVGMGKRQLEEMIPPGCGPHRRVLPVAGDRARRRDDHALVLTFDGKGIVMLPGALRPGHGEGRRGRAEQAGHPPVTRERRTAASGWPSWPASMTRSRSRAPRRTSSAPRRRSGGRRKRRQPSR